MVYGDGIKYSELTEEHKGAVITAQSHFRSWSVNRELQVVFSTNCKKFVDQDQFPKTVCNNCEKIVQPNAFKRALRVKPTPLERMKFIPGKYCGLLEDIGAKFTGVQGLTDLLQEVSLFLIQSKPTPNCK